MNTKGPGRRQFLKNIGASGVLGLPAFLWSQLNGEMTDRATVEYEREGIDDTWIQLNDKIYGARANAVGPLGGGIGYESAFTGGIEVRDLDGLIAAAASAVPGDIIFIPGDVTIDFTTYVYIDDFALHIPAGVTLASDRGYNGSPGALLTSDALKTERMILAMGEHVRLSGLRIQGPNGKRYLDHHAKSFGPGGERHAYYYKFPLSTGIETDHSALQVDNCEISAFSKAGVDLNRGHDHHVHHCKIHHCQYNGLGYGIVHNESTSLIEFNLFDSNRHSIAGTGRKGSGYIARHNVELGTSLSHCFDMHGGKDRKDGTQIAGRSIEIYNNTFRAPETPIGIRGEPEESCKVFRNWFVEHKDYTAAVRGHDWTGVKIYDNAYGRDPLEAR